jgi:hypothetical protein
MSIFEEMLPESNTLSNYEIAELERMLGQAIERGHIREISTDAPLNSARTRWFVETQSETIFSLTYPWERGWGTWRRLHRDALTDTTNTIQ